MMRKISTNSAPAPAGPYSQAIVTGGLAYLSGQGPFRSDGSKAQGQFEEQARQTLMNLAAVAEAAGGSLTRAVRVGVFLRDMENFPTLNAVYCEFFGEPLPARTTVQSNLPGFEVEIDAVVALD